MSEQEKCPECGAPESWMASGHEIGGKRCLRRQLAAKDAEIARWVAVFAGPGPLGNSVETPEDAVVYLRACAEIEREEDGAVKAENERLRKIVDRLAKTADNVPVAEGDRVYRPADPRCYYICGAQAVDGFAAFRIDTCYSSRKAAEKPAKEPSCESKC